MLKPNGWQKKKPGHLVFSKKTVTYIFLYHFSSCLQDSYYHVLLPFHIIFWILSSFSRGSSSFLRISIWSFWHFGKNLTGIPKLLPLLRCFSLNFPSCSNVSDIVSQIHFPICSACALSFIIFLFNSNTFCCFFLFHPPILSAKYPPTEPHFCGFLRGNTRWRFFFSVLSFLNWADSTLWETVSFSENFVEVSWSIFLHLSLLFCTFFGID